jgi:hypothetical protein
VFPEVQIEEIDRREQRDLTRNVGRCPLQTSLLPRSPHGSSDVQRRQRLMDPTIRESFWT